MEEIRHKKKIFVTSWSLRRKHQWWCVADSFRYFAETGKKGLQQPRLGWLQTREPGMIRKAIAKTEDMHASARWWRWETRNF